MNGQQAETPRDHADSGNDQHALIFAHSQVSDPEWPEIFDTLCARMLRHQIEVFRPQNIVLEDEEREIRFLDSAKYIAEIHIRALTHSNGYENHPHPPIPYDPHLNAVRIIKETEEIYNLDIVLMPNGFKDRVRATPGLAVFDMDSTLIQQEVIDELARAVGKYDEVAAITSRAMKGELDFQESLTARVALLEGVPITIWEQLKRGTVTFTPGARELTRCLRKLGWKTAVLSGGFMPLATWVKEKLGLDYAYANVLLTSEDGTKLTGKLDPRAPVVHAARKRELLLQLAAENGIPMENTLAVGDGSNDLLMMKAAGLGMAFNAKPSVQEAAPTKLNRRSLLDIMFLLGVTEVEVWKILAHGNRCTCGVGGECGCEGAVGVMPVGWTYEVEVEGGD
ncbi:hypothetical protein LTR62_004596 [Meristemomyces frigidus]|uniref:phosphoserine phosphatase n=1 Tax=Meristemomyces frigidus TaxID=1508187 RepID=A0AAN7YJT1_9PEZI|nr:hypothetical protein LTR62_004596 [Meristemomyces frigidus]